MNHKWKKSAWWIEMWEEKLSLTRSQMEIKSKLPSFLVGTTITSKTLLLHKIKSFMQALPIHLFFRILLYLNLECALYLQAMGLEEKLFYAISVYPAQICKAWKYYAHNWNGPNLEIATIKTKTLMNIRDFNKFFTSVTSSPLTSNKLFSKIQIDAINATFSAFNPKHPLIGMCLNNKFTYFVFATDSSGNRSESTAFSNNSHVKSILDFPNKVVDGVSWSPNGEWLVILTRATILGPQESEQTIFPVNLNISRFCPLTGIMRELTGVGNEIISACSRFVTPNLWIEDSSLLIVESTGRKFRKLVLNSDMSIIKEYHINSTEGLLKFVESLECSNPARMKNVVGGMSASNKYPKNVASFVMRCAAHCGTSHSSILLYNIAKNTCLKRIDLDGLLRSAYIGLNKTIYYAEHHHKAFFNKRKDATDDSPHKLCTLEIWIKKLYSDGKPFVGGSIYVLDHNMLMTSYKCTPFHDAHFDHTADEIYLFSCEATTQKEIYKSMYETSIDRSLQGCDAYAYICTETNTTCQTLVRINFYSGESYSAKTVYKPGRYRQNYVTVSQCGFQVFEEYSGFWKKPQITYSPFMPSRNCPVNLNYYSKLYYEKPIKVLKKYAKNEDK